MAATSGFGRLCRNEVRWFWITALQSAHKLRQIEEMNMRNLVRDVVTALTAMALLSSAVPACAQKTYPTKPIRFISPFSAGGSTDILARIIGQKMNEAWGQPVVVENRPGAGGNLGAEVVAKAAPDAHTLLLSASSVAINPSLYATMPFDTVKDLAPVGLAGMATNILMVHKQDMHSVV